MSEPTIFVCRPGAVSAKSRAELKRAGVIVVELDDPSQFKLLRASSEIDSSSMLAAALDALTSQPQVADYVAHRATMQRERFMKLLAELARAHVDKRNEGPQ